MQWVFSELRNSEVFCDPNEGEHFRNDQDDDEEYGGLDTLVREVIQNSIDAALGRSTVRVRFSLHSKEEMPPDERLQKYFERLKVPLKAEEVSYTLQGTPDVNLGFLVCEDFGTRGLVGDPMFVEVEVPSGEKNDFYHFWRNIARSGKADNDLGRWGLGKAVYQKASKVKCKFGLTVRESDKRTIVMGQSTLKIHGYEGKKYSPRGIWCEGLNENDTPIPIESPELVELFRKEWKLTRTNEPGLSVVVPYVAKLTGRSIFQAVAVNFFSLILLRKLEVEISTPEFGCVLLTDRTIEAECAKILWKGTVTQKRHTAPPLEFAKKCLAMKDIAIDSILWGKGKNLKEEKLTFDAQSLETLRSQFKKENFVAVKIHIFVLKKDKELSHENDDYFYVFLQQEDRKLPDKPDSYYIREGMTITKINSTRAKKNYVRGLVYINKGQLAAMLGDTEGAAHADWETSAERPEKLWKHGWKERVKFVKTIVDKLYDIVAPTIDKADYNLLSKYFSIEGKDIPQPSNTQDIIDNVGAENADTDNTENSTEELCNTESPFSSIESESKWFNFEKKSGGFRIFHIHSREIPLGAVLEIQMAYDVSQGNPLKQWHRFDFDLKNEKGRVKCVEKKAKASISNGEGNTIILEDISTGFSLTVTGFDKHKDLYVKIIDKSDDNKETEQ